MQAERASGHRDIHRRASEGNERTPKTALLPSLAIWTALVASMPCSAPAYAQPENAVKNATIPQEKGASGSNSAAINEMKARYLNVSKREQDISSRFGQDHAQAVALRAEQANLTNQIYAELQRLTESYRNEYQVAKSREDSLRGNVGDLAGQNSQTGQAQVKLRDLEQKSQALNTLYQAFLARYEQAAQQRSFPIAEARVISTAGNPTSASSPRKTMVLGLSLVLGLFAGRDRAHAQGRQGDDPRA